ncbi:MAG: hypothetical protein IKH61_11915 [Bacteroidales bacterium]|nr:hypothetical protein [Bacteroidales bacterium]
MYLKGRYLLLLLLALAACTPCHNDPVETRLIASPTTIASSELISIDSLMWQQPDSALMRLLPCFDTCCRDGVHTVSTAYNCHYAHLLLAELLYKNDCAQTNRPELQQAVSYFDSLVRQAFPPFKGVPEGRGIHTNNSNDILSFLDARAHYINGVGYYESDSAVDACKEYLKALEIMDERFGEKELVGKKAKFMAMTYTRLTELFSDFYLHEQAICYAHQSMFYYKKQATSSWFSSWVLNKIGTHYDMMDELDSASLYYQQASVALNDTSIILYRDIAAHQAFLHYRQNIGRTESTMQQLRQLLSLSTNEEEKHARRLTIGGIFIREKQLDSAWQYLNMVYFETSNVSAKKQAAEWLVEICKEQGRDSEIIEYANYLVPFANQDENNSGLKSQLLELYDKYRQKAQEKQHHDEVERHTKLIVLVLGGMSTILLSVIVFYRKNRRSKQKLEAQMEAERHAHKMQQAALAGRLKHSNAALKEQSKTKASTITPLPLATHSNNAENYIDESVCQQILAACNDKNNPIKSTVPVSAYAIIALSDVQKARLKKAAMRHYGSFFEKLRQHYPELKEKDFLYCYLCLLGLDNAQIAVLLQNSISTIWERENRLKKIFGSENKIAIILFGLMNN